MDTKPESDLRRKKAEGALGIAMAAGCKPSQLALVVVDSYINGELSAEQMKQVYLKKSGLIQ